MSYQINEQGFYGNYGGAFIPELLRYPVEELKSNYLKIIESEDFKVEYTQLLKDFVGRPTPLYYAPNLSKQYEAHIYLKREDLNHTGAHKINNSIGQALIAKRLGKKRIIAETGAGQHGVATAAACAQMGLNCIVYMGEIDMKRQASNVSKMKMLGAQVIPVSSGSKTLKDATNEAIRDWINHADDTYYIIGSVVGPHPYPDLVARLQSIISVEIEQQLKEKTGTSHPGAILACIGGGSNAAGAFYQYLDANQVKLYAAEAGGKGIETPLNAASCLTGSDGILHGSKSRIIQDKDGQIMEPYSISAGLDYPGIGPLHAHLFQSKRLQVNAVTDQQALEAAFNLCQKEGILPAIESAHALALLNQIDFKGQTIVINLSGRGDKDLATYLKHFER